MSEETQNSNNNQISNNQPQEKDVARVVEEPAEEIDTSNAAPAQQQPGQSPFLDFSQAFPSFSFSGMTPEEAAAALEQAYRDYEDQEGDEEEEENEEEYEAELRMLEEQLIGTIRSQILARLEAEGRPVPEDIDQQIIQMLGGIALDEEGDENDQDHERDEEGNSVYEDDDEEHNEDAEDEEGAEDNAEDPAHPHEIPIGMGMNNPFFMMAPPQNQMHHHDHDHEHEHSHGHEEDCGCEHDHFPQEISLSQDDLIALLVDELASRMNLGPRAAQGSVVVEEDEQQQ